MLRRPYEVFERAACMLARSAQPIQPRLIVASAIVHELGPDDFGNYQELKDTFENMTCLITRRGPSEDHGQIDLSGLSDEEAEQLAADLFDVFVIVARIHLSTH